MTFEKIKTRKMSSNASSPIARLHHVCHLFPARLHQYITTESETLMKALAIRVTRLYSQVTIYLPRPRTTLTIATSVNAEDRGGITPTRKACGPLVRNPGESSSATSTAASGWGVTAAANRLTLWLPNKPGRKNHYATWRCGRLKSIIHSMDRSFLTGRISLPTLSISGLYTKRRTDLLSFAWISGSIPSIFRTFSKTFV
ncbi:MAG: hypothetical protein Q9208_008798, partial [Pyrenodesmia sp. 3 TL-2023]